MGDISVRIQVDGKFPDRQRLNEPSNLVPTSSIYRNSYDFGPAVTGSLAQYVESGEFGFARRTPRCPKIQKQRTADERGQVHRPSGETEYQSRGQHLGGEITVN
jgi:hypothetical protein